MSLKPIKTNYMGHSFRSRLEARWAVFFQHMNMKWEYEPEGFITDDGLQYLPDFKVTTDFGRVIWYEIKPKEGTLGHEKFASFCKSLPEDETAVMLQGDPLDVLGKYLRLSNSDVMLSDDNCLSLCPRCGEIKVAEYGFNFLFGIEYGCEPCDFETPGGVSEFAEENFVGAYYWTHKGSVRMDNEGKNKFFKHLQNSCLLARNVKFENGMAVAS